MTEEKRSKLFWPKEIIRANWSLISPTKQLCYLKWAKEGYLVLLDAWLLFDTRENLGHVGFQNHASHDDFVQNEMDFVDVEDQVQLTDVLKALVQRLHKHLRQIQQTTRSWAKNGQRESQRLNLPGWGPEFQARFHRSQRRKQNTTWRNVGKSACSPVRQSAYSQNCSHSSKITVKSWTM